MKEQDVRIGMKVVPHAKTTGKEFQECPAWNTAKYINQPYLYVSSVKYKKEGKSMLCISENGGTGSFYNHTDFEPYIDTQEIAEALNKAFNKLTETLANVLQPLIDAPSRPEVAKALEAQEKDKGNPREEISKAFEEFRVSGTPYSSFTIFEAGYRAGRESK